MVHGLTGRISKMTKIIDKIADEIHFRWSLSKVRDWYWKLEHTINPGFRYHIVHTGLPSGYYDPDIKILHTVMEEVTAYFEVECSETEWIDLEHNFDKSDVFWELLEIYEYWEWRKNFTTHFRGSDCDHLEKEGPVHLMDQPRDYFDCLQKLAEKDHEVDLLDQEMLRRAINIRLHLWH